VLRLLPVSSGIFLQNKKLLIIERGDAGACAFVSGVAPCIDIEVIYAVYRVYTKRATPGFREVTNP